MAYQKIWVMFKQIMLWVVLAVGLWSCSDRLDASIVSDLNPESQSVVTQQLTEVATPSLINELRPAFDQYQPQVKILSPKPDETINDTTVTVQLQVDDLPLFKDEELGLGPHVHLFIDDLPYQAVYDANKPIVLTDLTPGSHFIRAFASRPWHESFKNEGAYAETSFNVFTKTEQRLPSPQLPLLTYSRPQGTVGAQPVMLDFYLANAPLHFVAQEDSTDNINDWRIRVTINGESFILDQWRPVYLEGFNKGKNWLKLEFVDDQGELVENVFNSPVRVIDYDPKLKDSLAKLVQNKLPRRVAQRLVTGQPLLVEESVEERVPQASLEEDLEQLPLDEENDTEPAQPVSIPTELNQTLAEPEDSEAESFPDMEPSAEGTNRDSQVEMSPDIPIEDEAPVIIEEAEPAASSPSESTGLDSTTIPASTPELDTMEERPPGNSDPNESDSLEPETNLESALTSEQEETEGRVEAGTNPTSTMLESTAGGENAE